MGLVEELGVRPGITAIVGSGGKTTLMELLARELAGAGGGGHVPSTPSANGIDSATETACEPQASSSATAKRRPPQASSSAAMRRPPQASGVTRTVALTTTTRVLPPVDFPLLANLSAAEVATCLPTVGVAYVGSVRETKGVRKLGAPLWRSAPGTGEKHNPASQTYAFTRSYAPNSTAHLTGLGADASTDVFAGLSATAGANASAGVHPSTGGSLSAYKDTPATTNALASESREDVVASIETLASLATYTLAEADGSHHLPLKAHASWEPVVPAGAHTILVVGAFGFGQPVEKVVHRPELFCERTGCSPADLATPELVAQEIASEVQEGRISFDTVLATGESSVGDAAIRKFAEALRANGISAPVHIA